MTYAIQDKQGEELNRLYAEDLPVHQWYRFVLSFPPHLIRDLAEKLSVSSDERILDPFCGTGTTLVEARKLGIRSAGIEANPVVHFAASVKTDWAVDPEGLRRWAAAVADEARAALDAQMLDCSPLFRPANAETLALKKLGPEQERLLIRDSISPLPLHRTLTLLETMKAHADPCFDRHARLALARQLTTSISNLRFGPEIGVGKIKKDAPVVDLWLQGVRAVAADLELVQRLPDAEVLVHRGDARQAAAVIAPASVDVVITSPPYPNEKDYSRTTRLESVLLGFLASQHDLRRQKQQFVRSNTRAVYKDDTDDVWVAGLPRVQALASEIERRRIELQKTSGFERLYARVVRLYFGGMARHLDSLKPVLRPGARLAYVVGDQASYFRVMIRTGGNPGRNRRKPGLRCARCRSVPNALFDGNERRPARRNCSAALEGLATCHDSGQPLCTDHRAHLPCEVCF